jgi:hypothetical protein
MNQFMPYRYPLYGAYNNIYPQQITPIQSQQPVTHGLYGMIVQGIENITADSVPMDGSAAFFPKIDLSEIYVKSWNSDGTIRTITFKPASDTAGKDKTQEAAETKSNDFSARMESQFGELIEKINKLESSINALKKQNFQKENKNT